MRTMPRPPRRSRWSITAWRLVTTFGVIDCLEAALTCPWDEYLAWIATLEAGGEDRTEMEGVPKYGEIVIDINHVPMLANAFDKARAAQTSQQQEWSTMLLSMLHDIHQENAIYLMVKS